MPLRIMTEQDIPAGVRLNTHAGWNQTAADWHRFLESSPRGCFVAEEDARVVGTATTITYENRFAWIGMVLVDHHYQKRGIGTQLLKKAIDYLDASGVATLKLDATPQGQPLYRRLGFLTEYEIERWILKKSPMTDRSKPQSNRAPLTNSQRESLFAVDHEVFGADRRFLLRSLSDGSPEFSLGLWDDGLPQGYAFGRRGLFADHLGPWMARSRAAAQTLFQEFLARTTRETLIVDCLTSNSVAVDLVRAGGFVRSRPLTRMVRGPNTYPGKVEPLCAILGPEFG
jgi:predicted N-acetyltransferase YhbS